MAFEQKATSLLSATFRAFPNLNRWINRNIKSKNNKDPIFLKNNQNLINISAIYK